MNWEYQLVGDYMTIEKVLQLVSPERLNRTETPQISDCEVLAVYFWGMRNGHRTVYSIHQFVASYLRTWFPTLPGYQQYVKRLNRLADVLELIFGVLCFGDQKADRAVIDSMPIVVASASRSSRSRVAKDLCSKGYCASKKTYYYGCKLHLVVAGDVNKAPYIMLAGDISPAAEHDIRFLQRSHLIIDANTLIGDKAYRSEVLSHEMRKTGLDLVCPPKKPKGQDLSFGEHLIGSLISSTRQAIETAFGWIEARTGISKASKVRSSAGLRRHVFGALAAVALSCA